MDRNLLVCVGPAVRRECQPHSNEPVMLAQTDWAMARGLRRLLRITPRLTPSITWRSIDA